VTGAYRFDIRPGWETVVTVEARIFTRQEEVETLGVAPLTSMFWYGENTARPEWEQRPKVHDSDGLLMAGGSGELLWRPLDNPEALRVSAFDDINPRGFGLLQRDREFNSYRDLWALYHRRPSVWVEPIGEWGEGAVELIEIPTVDEYHDNIVAAWVPKEVVGPGEKRAFAYRLRFGPDAPAFAPVGRTVATRVEAGTTGAPRFVVNFDGAALRALNAATPPEAVVRASSGRIANEMVERDKATDGWRISFDLLPEGSEPVELSCFLTFGGTALTETWRYSWSE
jgi:periplasmic glucans biosynthesis protein